jgi:uncharacterized protein (DUF302 family)
MRVTVPQDLDTVLERLRGALADEGFGVLTEIDVQATLHTKIGAEVEPYRILGVCNPRLAHQALEIDRSVGLLLPCTVVLREGDAGSTVLEVQDPAVMVSVTGEPRLRVIADEAARRLSAAVRRLVVADAA